MGISLSISRQAHQHSDKERPCRSRFHLLNDLFGPTDTVEDAPRFVKLAHLLILLLSSAIFFVDAIVHKSRSREDAML